MDIGRIVHADLFDYLPTLPADSIDLVVTSPPYFDARNYGGEALFKEPLEWLKFCLLTLKECQRIIKPEGAIWWNTGAGYQNYQRLPHTYALVVGANELGLGLIDEIPWIKKSSPPKKYKNMPYHGWETNFIFAKNPSQVIYYPVYREYSKSTLERMKYPVSNLMGDKDGEFSKRKLVEPNEKGATSPNYIVEPQDTTSRPHPATMLPALANWAIRAYTEPGEIVLDPLCGAGTTLVEAQRLGRQWLGCELFEEYIELAYLSLARLKVGADPYRGLKNAWNELKGENSDERNEDNG